jgi:hypothetical protein
MKLISPPACSSIKAADTVYSNTYGERTVKGKSRGGITFCNSKVAYFIRVVGDERGKYHPGHFDVCDKCLYKSDKQQGLSNYYLNLKLEKRKNRNNENAS